MDHGHLDELARSMVSDAGSRRPVLHLLAGGALRALGARFGLVADAAAMAKKRRRTH